MVVEMVVHFVNGRQERKYNITFLCGFVEIKAAAAAAKKERMQAGKPPTLEE